MSTRFCSPGPLSPHLGGREREGVETRRKVQRKWVMFEILLFFFNYCFGSSLRTFFQHPLHWDCTPGIGLSVSVFCELTDLLPRSEAAETEALLSTVVV